MLEVVEPGLLLTLQDAGRRGHGDLGIPPSGACDPWGLAVANLLAGAPPAAVALEITLGGAELLARETCVIALGGADLGAERDDGAWLAAEAAHRIPAGARVRFAGFPHGAPGTSRGAAGPLSGPTRGARAYLAMAGGISTPPVLGSGSTLVAAGLGGREGRALRAGDVLEPARPGALDGMGRTWPARLAPHPATAPGPVRFVAGPDVDRLPPGSVERLAATAWRVAAASDRMGIRLEGPPLAAGVEILSHPLVPGAIQVPPDGQPVVLLVDGPTIGGYPVPGVVIRAAMPRLGQLLPGEDVRFVPVTAGHARRAWREQRVRLLAAAEALGADDVWDRLVAGAGG